MKGSLWPNVTVQVFLMHPNPQRRTLLLFVRAFVLLCYSVSVFMQGTQTLDILFFNLLPDSVSSQSACFQPSCFSKRFAVLCRRTWMKSEGPCQTHSSFKDQRWRFLKVDMLCLKSNCNLFSILLLNRQICRMKLYILLMSVGYRLYTNSDWTIYIVKNHTFASTVK